MTTIQYDRVYGRSIHQPYMYNYTVFNEWCNKLLSKWDVGGSSCPGQAASW